MSKYFFKVEMNCDSKSVVVEHTIEAETAGEAFDQSMLMVEKEFMKEFPDDIEETFQNFEASLKIRRKV